MKLTQIITTARQFLDRGLVKDRRTAVQLAFMRFGQ